MKTGTYNIYIHETGFLPYQEEIFFPDKKNMTLNIQLTEIKAGAKAVMRNIYFAPNSSTITIDALAGLDRIVTFMKENPSVKIRINGHTDKGTTAEFNQKLSESRAISVKDYLTQMGIDEHRIETKGWGNTQPIADNGTIEGRKKNRRIEIEIID
jgi:outer membrane protein OmpA-like peptidoglycan-associated protein